MTAPALSWGLFGRDADEAGQPRVPEQAGSERGAGEEPAVLLTAEQPDRPERPDPVVLAAPSEPVRPDQAALDRAALDRAAAVLETAGPAERALRAAARELGGPDPLDRVEQAPPPARHSAPTPQAAPGAGAAGPGATDHGPSAAPPVLDVLPSGGGRRRSLRDAVLPLVLLAELLTGVWLGSAKPWQGGAPDPLQARFASTAPASDDLLLPEPAASGPGAGPSGAGEVLLRTPPPVATPPDATPQRRTDRPVDPFSPR